ncbi:DUF4422 domain-containing protein [Mycetohabitans sp. B5]|uniref:Lipopolysaccharide biosynthesis glycosyltransferase n=1 Tax=Mycetohabitans endofungorum TaxID=417203 RepID=A0A2P5KEQ9_9BURK|nr:MULTISPECIES: DUF4422 domain-containing protein [Mycetohabitans]MCG1054014.1 DUF4422 domain-containing protein [Mycetohabitans sp. B5]PPB85184.1 lipopolysaccharide biosynthesis glycosyltransferase [Mycetohabitans endofungorum]
MSTTNSPVHIYVCHHKPGPATVSDRCFLPIQVGASRSSVDLGLRRDDAGDNISHKNGTFCELTALYWAWKNDRDAQWIGLMHYRRFLDFSGATHEIDVHGCVNYDRLDEETIETLGLTASRVEALLVSKPGLLAVLPQKWSVRNAGNRTLRAHYVKAMHHYEADLDVLRAVIGDLYPTDVEHFDAVMDAHEGYFTNIFVLRRDLFDEYCQWVFSVLFEVERRLDLTNYSVAAQRVFGYMSERLFNVFARKRLADPATYVELERVFVRDQRVEYRAPARPADNAVSVVTASDGNFVPHLATFMTSVQANLDPQRELDLIVLDGGIPEYQRALLERQFRLNGRGRLTFLSCSDMFADIPLHAHFSAATFYRLSLGELLANHDRVVYVDADTVVLGDLSAIYDLDLDRHAVGAVPDVIMRSFAATGVPALKEAGGARAGDYLRDWLGMGNRGDEYFQAGLIVMDLEALRAINLREHAYSDLTSKRYWFLDQDVLNKHLLGRVKFLDLSWNVVNASMDVISGLGANLAEKVREAFAAPQMVHYAGFEAKPWNNPAAPLAHFYWYYLRRTFWYEAVVERRPIAAPTLDAGMNRSRFYRFARKIWRRMPNALQRRLFWVRDQMM